MSRGSTRRKNAAQINLTCEQLLSAEFYKKIMPSLTFGDGAHINNLPHAHPPKSWKPTVCEQGVIDLQPVDVWGTHGYPKELFTKLSHALTRLKLYNLPIWLIGCSKEAQLLMRLIGAYVKAAVNKPGYENTGDYAIFHINTDAKGWVPHRDRDELENALEPDGLPNYITAWMPITDATPKSSCLYFIPRMYDSTYDNRDGGDEYMKKLFATDEFYQNILSLPMTTGGLLCFTSRIIHWGSKPLPPIKGSKVKYTPRQAISITVANRKFEKVALAREGASEFPTFLESVLLAISQALRYNHQNPISKEHQNCFKKILKNNLDSFETAHRKIIEDLF